jgi:RNA polymerase-interacting CarD/CdnL/TRCF family regulator
MMARKILLVLADAAQAKVVRRSLTNSRDSPLEIEWVSRCGDAIKRLGSAEVADIAAVVVDLFLPDSERDMVVRGRRSVATAASRM